MIMTDGQSGSGGVLSLRNLAMIENIRRAEDPAWRERLERQQVVARLGRLFAGGENPLQAMHDHAAALKEELDGRPCPGELPRAATSLLAERVPLGDGGRQAPLATPARPLAPGAAI